MIRQFFFEKAGFSAIMVSAFCCLLACSNDHEGNATLAVYLTDAPADYQQVNIDVQGVEVNVGGEQNSEWTTLQVEAGVYDVLELTGGVEALLGTVNLPAGKIGQIRLKLGENNSIMVNDEIESLTTPSAQTSGLKLNVHSTLEAGVTYKLLLDFDAARSIIHTGNNNFSLKPVVRTFVEAQSGAIKGTVAPVESNPAIYAIIDEDTLATAFANQSTGEFLLRGLPAGEIKVTFEPIEGFSSKVIADVAVDIGKVTDVGEVEIQ
ncbi:MAG: DUF4382 domain-containing protein [Cyclobacteriaceae bacterium]